jgi:transposase
MKFIKGESRNQVQLFCLEQAVGKDNEVRLIDLFINILALKDYGFKSEFNENGRPAYHPADLLRLFIYGYLNRIRSSRHLEKECKRNLELMWLLRGLAPDHTCPVTRDNSRVMGIPLLTFEKTIPNLFKRYLEQQYNLQITSN